MKKAIKKGLGILATTACALTFAYAQPSTEKQAEPYPIEKTVEIYEEYIKKWKSAKSNGYTLYWEIQELDDFLEQHLLYMPKSEEEIKKIVNYINNKREKEAKYITHEVKNEEDKKEHDSLIKDLKEILKHFPGLEEGSSSIKYNADKVLDEYHNQLTKKLIKKSNESLEKRKNQDLSYLVEKEQYTIQDLLAFSTIIRENRDLYDTKIEKKMKEREPDINFFNYLEHKKAFEDYLNDVKKWEEHKDPSYPYISAGPLYGLYDKTFDTKVSRPRNNTDKKLEEMFDPKGHKIKVIEDKIPLKTLIPPWLGIILSFGGVIVAKEFMRRYARRKWDDEDTMETVIHTLTGPWFDLFHPFIFPIRTIGVPLVSEFLGKFSWGRKNRRGIKLFDV